jgi:hypothetical protein
MCSCGYTPFSFSSQDLVYIPCTEALTLLIISSISLSSLVSSPTRSMFRLLWGYGLMTLGKIWGSHSGGYEEYYPLGYNVM